MIDSILAILGMYVPVTYTTYIYDSVNNIMIPIEVIPNGLAGVDLPWVLSALVFLGFLYFTYKIFYLLIPINPNRRYK